MKKLLLLLTLLPTLSWAFYVDKSNPNSIFVAEVEHLHLKIANLKVIDASSGTYLYNFQGAIVTHSWDEFWEYGYVFKDSKLREFVFDGYRETLKTPIKTFNFKPTKDLSSFDLFVIEAFASQGFSNLEYTHFNFKDNKMYLFGITYYSDTVHTETDGEQCRKQIKMEYSLIKEEILNTAVTSQCHDWYEY